MFNSDIKNLVVGVDLSSYSNVVVEEARQLSRRLSIPATYVYVFQDPAVFDRTFVTVKGQIKEYYERRVRVKYQLKKEDSVIIKYGRPFEEIIAVAKKYINPMIIVGHKGHNPLARLFIGSTAERLALHSPYPLWIHRGVKIQLPHKVLVPCDLSGRSQHAIQEMGGLKKVLGANIELYHVQKEPPPLLDFEVWSQIHRKMKSADEARLKNFKKRNPSLKTVRASGDVVGNIQKRAKKFDLIAVTPRDHRKGNPAFGSVTAKLVRTGEKPILILP